MKQKVFSVYDSKAESYGTPMFFPTIGQATRAFFDETNREESVICNHPGDFNLYMVGEFDLDTGELTPSDPKKSLGTGLEFKNKEQ